MNLKFLNLNCKNVKFKLVKYTNNHQHLPFFVNQFEITINYYSLDVAQEKAKKDRLHMWKYGDITEDDTKKFNYVK